MKKLFPLICFLFCCSKINAQVSDSIPNAGFEGWIFVGWSVNPGSWDTNNIGLLAPTIVPDSNGYSGALAMKMINSGALRPYASCGFSILHHPLALYGYVKNQLLNNDSAILMVHVYDNSILVDSGYQVMYGGFNPNYSSFSVVVSQNYSVADSCVITFLGGTRNTSSLSFDDLSFTYPSAIYEFGQPLEFSVSPNPTHDVFYIQLPCISNHKPATACMYDGMGRKMREEKLVWGEPPLCRIGADSFVIETLLPVNSQNGINVENLPGGIYFLTIISGDKTGTHRIIKE